MKQKERGCNQSNTGPVSTLYFKLRLIVISFLGVWSGPHKLVRNYTLQCGWWAKCSVVSLWFPSWHPLTYLSSTKQDVQVNEMDNQIMSISADSVIKVWDMRSSRCLQTITEKSLWEPSRCTLYYDNKQQVLLWFESQWSGRFLGITVWDPSVCKSNRLHVDILWFSFDKLGCIP